ncbi:hypothetical protein [Leyella stercorea]|uniref:hypothetical protein n=1 Tax=Leyella stercorea TaxID=363265 RepID=UPI002674108C|nr:hypothetical protein [Leyella stercorea]
MYIILLSPLAFATRSDCVRHPIRLRSESNQIAFGILWHLVGGYGIPAVAIADSFP